MKILGMGLPELLVILAVAIIIFGPKNLPKLGSALGKTVKNIREGMEDGDDDESEDKASKSEAPAKDVKVVEDSPDADEDADADLPDDDEDADVSIPAADEDEGRFCTKCGTYNDADSAFCKKCGNKLK